MFERLLRVLDLRESLLFFRFLRRRRDGNGAECEHGTGDLRRGGLLPRHQHLAIAKVTFVAEKLESRSGGREEHRPPIFGSVQNRGRKVLTRHEITERRGGFVQNGVVFLFALFRLGSTQSPRQRTEKKRRRRPRRTVVVDVAAAAVVEIPTTSEQQLFRAQRRCAAHEAERRLVEKEFGNGDDVHGRNGADLSQRT